MHGGCRIGSGGTDLSTEGTFTRFVLAHRGSIVAFLKGRGVAASEAEDLCQTAFTILWQRRYEAADPPAFLFGTAKRLAAEHHRKLVRLVIVILPDQDVLEDADSAAPPPRPAKSALRAVAQLLDLLPRRQRQVVDCSRSRCPVDCLSHCTVDVSHFGAIALREKAPHLSRFVRALPHGERWLELR